MHIMIMSMMYVWLYEGANGPLLVSISLLKEYFTIVARWIVARLYCSMKSVSERISKLSVVENPKVFSKMLKDIFRLLFFF